MLKPSYSYFYVYCLRHRIVPVFQRSQKRRKTVTKHSAESYHTKLFNAISLQFLTIRITMPNNELIIQKQLSTADGLCRTNQSAELFHMFMSSRCKFTTCFWLFSTNLTVPEARSNHFNRCSWDFSKVSSTNAEAASSLSRRPEVLLSSKISAQRVRRTSTHLNLVPHVRYFKITNLFLLLMLCTSYS